MGRMRAGGDQDGFDALVLDGSYKQSLASVRCLGRAGLRVAVGESLASDPVPAYYSRYCARRLLLPSYVSQPDAFAAAVVDFVREFPTRVVMPAGDETIAAVAPVREELAGLGCTLALAPDDALRVANSKELTLKVAGELGLLSPRTMAIESAVDVPAVIADLGFPFVMKPTTSWTGQHWERLVPVDILSEPEAVRVAESFRAAGAGVLAQQFAPGRREGVTLFIGGGEVLASCGHVAYRNTPPLGGSSTVRESIQVPPDLYDASVRLAKAIGIEGPCEVEFRRDGDGQPLLMEINPRLAGTLEIAVQSGVNIPLMTWRWAAGLDVQPVAGHRAGVRTRWLAGDLAWLTQNWQRGAGRPDGVPAMKSLELFTTEFFRGDHYDFFDRHDLRPGLAELHRMTNWARRFLSKRRLSKTTRSEGAINDGN